MKIVRPPHKISARPVSDSELTVVSLIAGEMQTLLQGYNDQGQNGMALHNAQVDDRDPKNFFVIKREVVGAKDNEVCLIINPKILERTKGSYMFTREGCMSFPFSPAIRVRRASEIKVEYFEIAHSEDEGLYLVRKEVEVKGVIAQIFQHENLHCHAQHIYQ